MGQSKVETVLNAYAAFLKSLEHLLVNRHNSLLMRQATIFSTNYDLFVERASELLPNMILNDGFDRRPSLTGKFKLRPERYFNSTFHTGRRYDYRTELPSVNLIKLHGSLNWSQEGSDIFHNGLYTHSVASHLEADTAPTIEEVLATSAVVLPHKGKHHKTTIEKIYYEQLRIFSNELDIENCLLFVFGFSFSDVHINDLLIKALQNPTLKVIIPCYELGSVAELNQMFDGFHNVTILQPGKTGDFDFAWLTELIIEIGQKPGPNYA